MMNASRKRRRSEEGADAKPKGLRGLGWIDRKYGRMYRLRGTPEGIAQFGKTYKEADESQRAARRQYGYTGRGGYFGRLAGRVVGGLVGASDLGGELGDKLGDYIGPKIRKMFTGKGQYVENNLISPGDPMSEAVPSFVTSRDGSSVVITHKEYVGDVYVPLPSTNDTYGMGGTGIAGNINFHNYSYQINPGLEHTFPWLSQIAVNYDEYTLKQCMFTYRATVSDVSNATGQVGTVIMATNYNAASEPFTDKQSMMEYDSVMSSKASESMVHGVECDPLKLSGASGRFIRGDAVQEVTDVNVYDHAQFNIAVANVPTNYAGASLGELWISYTVELRKPRFFASRGMAISRDYFLNRNTAVAQTPFAVNAGYSVLQGKNNSIGCEIICPQTGSAIMPAGARRYEYFTPNTPTDISNTSLDWKRTWALKFPAYAQGVYRIVFRCQYTVPGTTNGTPANDVSTTITPIVTPGISFVYDIQDGYSGTIADGWKPFVFTTGMQTPTPVTPVQTNYGGLTFELHVRLEPTPSERIIYFHDAAGNFQNSQNAWCDVSEYNAGFNYKQDGTNDSIVLVTKNGSQVQVPTW